MGETLHFYIQEVIGKTANKQGFEVVDHSIINCVSTKIKS